MDILSADPETIVDTKVLATYLDGKLVYAAPDGTAERPEGGEEGAWWDEREARIRERLHRD